MGPSVPLSCCFIPQIPLSSTSPTAWTEKKGFHGWSWMAKQLPVTALRHRVISRSHTPRIPWHNDSHTEQPPAATRPEQGSQENTSTAEETWLTEICYLHTFLPQCKTSFLTLRCHKSVLTDTANTVSRLALEGPREPPISPATS